MPDYLEVRTSLMGEVVVSHSKWEQDEFKEKIVLQLMFSPCQARRFAQVLMKKADVAEKSQRASLRKKSASVR